MPIYVSNLPYCKNPHTLYGIYIQEHEAQCKILYQHQSELQVVFSRPWHVFLWLVEDSKNIN